MQTLSFVIFPRDSRQKLYVAHIDQIVFFLLDMAVNSSLFNDSHLHPNLHSGIFCLLTSPSSLIFITFNITNILILLPLCIIVLYMGFQRWQQQRSTATATTTSHSDSFAYHMVAMDLFNILGATLSCWGSYVGHATMLTVGLSLMNITWFGEICFHTLTCVEPYLAVVHPVTYLSLRRERGVRIRNVTLGCVWLLCIGTTILTFSNDRFFFVDVCLIILSFTVVTFWSLSVLCVLIRPGPGEQGGDRERVDQSKRKALYTIVAILGVLLLKFCGNLVWLVIHMSGDSSQCVMMTAVLWASFPSSLLLPLLFLQRAGTFACCKKNTDPPRKEGKV